MGTWDVMKASLHDRMNASVQNLFAEYVDASDQLELLDKQIKDVDKKLIVDHCRPKVEALKEAIDHRKIVAAWRLLHRVQEELLLLVEPAQLRAEAQRVSQTIQLSALSETLKKEWMARLDEAMKKIENNGANEEMKARQLIKMAANVINDFTDDQFWDIWARRWMSFIYSGMIMVLMPAMMFALYFYAKAPSFAATYALLLMLGAIGGYASGIWGSGEEYFAKGYFWTYTCYYGLARPVSGILAALVMFWMLQVQLYIKVDPPISAVQVAAPMAATPAAQPVSRGTNTTEAKPPSPAAEPTLITIKTPGKDVSVYAYMLLLLVAGFAGDKLLKSLTDKVMKKLFAEAEKTKDAGKSGT